MNLNVVIVIAVIFTGILLFIRERNRAIAQQKSFGRVIGFKEGMRLTIENIGQQFKDFDWNLIGKHLKK